MLVVSKPDIMAPKQAHWGGAAVLPGTYNVGVIAGGGIHGVRGERLRPGAEKVPVLHLPLAWDGRMGRGGSKGTKAGQLVSELHSQTGPILQLKGRAKDLQVWIDGSAEQGGTGYGVRPFGVYAVINEAVVGAQRNNKAEVSREITRQKCLP